MLQRNLSRRDLLRTAAAGGAILAMPKFLAACGPKTPVEAAAGALPANPFMAWFGVDEAMLSRVLGELTSRGADKAELFFQHSRGSWVNLEDGIVSRAYTSIQQGVGLRVVVGDQVGFAFTEDLTEEAMRAAAQTAAAIASGAARPPVDAFDYPTYHDYYRLEVPWSEVGIDQKLPIIQQAEAAARDLDRAIDKVSVSYSDQQEKILIATADGKILTDDRPMSRLWVNVTARKGEEVQANAANIAGRYGFDHYSPEAIDALARKAVDKTMILFDARRPPAGELPVVLAAGASGILLHEAIGHGMEADFNRKGTSIFSELMGKKVAEDFVTIVDDGTLDYERGTINIDDEGAPAEHTVLVENGTLRSYLHDSISSRHYGVPLTGSGRRESYRFPPMPRMRCTYMENGPHTRDEIVASVEYGIIAETFTNGQVQIGAGDFTFYIKNGWLIENGAVTAPIKDINIIGNGPEALRKMTMVADDFRQDSGGWTCGKNGQSVPVSLGLPTVLVSSMTVGGENA